MKSPLCADCCATCCSAQSLAHSGTPYLCFMTTEEVMTRRGKEPAQGLSASQGRPGTGVQAGHIHSPTEPREAPQTGSRLKGRAERTRGRGAGPPSQHRGSWPTFLKHQYVSDCSSSSRGLTRVIRQLYELGIISIPVLQTSKPRQGAQRAPLTVCSRAHTPCHRAVLFHPSMSICPESHREHRSHPGEPGEMEGERAGGNQGGLLATTARTRPSTCCRPLGFDVPRGLASLRPPCQDPSPGRHRRRPRLMQQPPSGLPT